MCKVICLESPYPWKKPKRCFLSRPYWIDYSLDKQADNQTCSAS
jgi:hypothetical protein